MLNLHNFKLNLAASEIRNTTIDGRSHMILPATILVEGVHNGSAGPLLYPADELRASIAKWNGRPVVLNHPMAGGIPISVDQTPDKIIGRIQNTRMDGVKLRAELHLDRILAEAKAPQVLQALNAGRDIDVSTGLFSSDVPAPGTFQGKRYAAVVREIRPDHLAVLLDQKGACSFEAGCGIRANSSSCWQPSKKDWEFFISKGVTTMTINETPMEIKRPYHCADPSALETVRAALVANHGQERGVRLLQEMSADAIEREAARLLASCGGRCDDTHHIVNGEQPLELPKLGLGR